MKILVTGGAGYIGSQTAHLLRDQGFDPIVLDDFAFASQRFISGIKTLDCNLLDSKKLINLLKNEKVESVIHFAAHSIVSESITNPNKYFANNIKGTLNLLETCVLCGIDSFIFSSTAAVYGVTKLDSISTTQPLKPINPYGMSKKICEDLIYSYSKFHNISAICFRYFNVAGADPNNRTGECHQPETHLIPNIIDAALSRKPLTIYGNDYNTKDGSCIRDYVHVCDIGQAHINALSWLKNSKERFNVFNLGSGVGYSVFEILHTVEQIMDESISFIVSGRRAGDPDKLIANIDGTLKNFSWEPQFTLKDIIFDAVSWHKKLVK